MQQDSAERPKYIPMYYSYIEQLGLLSPEQIGNLIMALLAYGRDGTQPDFPKDSNVYMAFSFIADNSMRAEIRRQEIVEKRREAGRARAASAEKDENGRFVQQKTSKKPAHSSKTSIYQQIQLYKDKDKDKDKDNLLPSEEREDREDCLLKAVENSESVEYYRDLIGQLDAKEYGILLEYEKAMGTDALIDAITIAYENGAQSFAYVRKTIETKIKHPEYKPTMQ